MDNEKWTEKNTSLQDLDNCLKYNDDFYKYHYSFNRVSKKRRGENITDKEAEKIASMVQRYIDDYEDYGRKSRSKKRSIDAREARNMAREMIDGDSPRRRRR
jgi:hypothetical protein